MYRHYMTQAEYDEIANGKYSDEDTFPHCNQSTFHRPQTCAYCDGYYKSHPAFTPETYAAAEANGWGGNMAPIVDDEEAAKEEAVWTKMMDRLTDVGRRRYHGDFSG